jgi:hypothetical protein
LNSSNWINLLFQVKNKYYFSNYGKINPEIIELVVPGVYVVNGVYVRVPSDLTVYSISFSEAVHDRVHNDRLLVASAERRTAFRWNLMYKVRTGKHQANSVAHLFLGHDIHITLR